MNPVVEAGEPVLVDTAISMKKKVKNYLDKDNTDKATSFFQKGSSKHNLKLTLSI